MSGMDRVVEEIIRAAIEEGRFDNLPGAGKPLKLDENPYEPEGWGVAFRLLKNNGFTLPWIALRAEIEEERLEAQRKLRAGTSQREEFLERIAALNRKILSYNLQVPSPAFQRHPLDPHTELKQALSQSSLPSES